jgi:dTDP-4-dehydrorhamnose reductase
MSLEKQKVLLTGAAGMLAGDLIPLLRQQGAELSLFDIRETAAAGESIRMLDITDAAAVRDVFQQIRPNWVVNCAAYTAVDKAETEYDKAFAINASALEHLALCARQSHATVLHLSTDYVFGGAGGGHKAGTPFAEEDAAAPCGIYGQSKRFGEDLLRWASEGEFLLVRTSWLHGIHGPNFVDTMLRVGKEQSMLKVVNDQIGSPTWTGWLAHVLLRLMERDARGVFHASSHGGISWYEFAREIFHQASMSVDVRPQTTAELDRPAPRPPYSVFQLGKLERFLGEACISWKECVTQHLLARGIEIRDHV